MIVVSQFGNHCVQMFESTTGRFMFQFGGEGSGDLQFQNPWGVGVDREGNLVVCDGDNGCVKVIEVGRMEWSRKNHELFPVGFKKAVFFVMVAWSRRGQWIECSRRRRKRNEEEKEKEKEEKAMNVFAQVPFELIEEIVSFLGAVW